MSSARSLRLRAAVVCASLAAGFGLATPGAQIQSTMNITPVYEGWLPNPDVGSSRVDLQACKLEYSIVSPK